jgi:hypothetical protein
MPPTIRRPTKAENKRARNEAAQRAAAAARRRSRNVRAAWAAAGAALLVLVVGGIVLLTRDPGGHGSSTAAGTPDATQAASGPGTPAAATGAPLWNPPADVAGAVAAAGLKMLSAEGTALHIHAHLDVIVDGKPVVVPPEIGIDETHQQISALHSHDTTGVIHVESPDASASFTLGQFFTEWQVPLAADHIGGLTVDGTHQLKAYVNGAPYTGDPAGIVLKAHEEITLVYGTATEPVTVPSAYQWTNGL